MPRTSVRAARPEPADFDEFYIAIRRRLLLQCFALTGDLTASRSAVRDAFVAARHHWRKVSRLEDPGDWVRPRAWSIAQRRSVTRIRHREKGLTEQQAAVLEALAKLPDVQRKTILLAHLASVPLPAIGRELGQTAEATGRNLQQASSTLALALHCDSALLRNQLESLAPLVASPGLPRVTIIRRNGRRRRRLHAIGGSVIALAVAAGAGWFVTTGTTTSDHPQVDLEKPVTAAMLLGPAQAAPLAPQDTWHVTSTSNNTKGSGINVVCQRTRFADDRGLGTWVRKMGTSGKHPRDFVQTVEVSASPGAGVAAYDTAVQWFAGCGQARVQLDGAWSVTGVGEKAEVFRLSMARPTPEAWLVGLVRNGAVTTTTAVRTAGHGTDPVPPLARTMSTGMRRLCGTTVITRCRAGTPSVSQEPLPRPVGGVPGVLATVDLPAVADVQKPWVATSADSAQPNSAATTCDRTSFAQAQSAKSVTYLIPEAKLPERFGLTETYGKFASRSAASDFIGRVRQRMGTCEHRQLGTKIRRHVDHKGGKAGSSYSLWRLTAEINSHKAVVSYWMGVVQVGRYVSQVTLTPTGKDDVSARAFEALVVRARDRLLELP